MAGSSPQYSNPSSSDDCSVGMRGVLALFEDALLSRLVNRTNDSANDLPVASDDPDILVRTTEWKYDTTESEIDLSASSEPDIDLTGWTDQEIEDNMHVIAGSKLRTAAVLISALKVKPHHPSNTTEASTTTGICAAPGCKKAAYTNTHISWCELHEKQLVEPIGKDIEEESKQWPAWLQEWLTLFDTSSVSLSNEEVHRLLYEVALPKLQEVSRQCKLSKEETAKKQQRECNSIIKAIATYQSRFNPIPAVAFLLLKLALIFLVSFYALRKFQQSSGASVAIGTAATAAAGLLATTTATATAPILSFCAMAATATITTVIGVGVWRSRAFFAMMGCGALIGAGVGTLILGPAGAAAGALIGAGVTGMVAKSHSKEEQKSWFLRGKGKGDRKCSHASTGEDDGNANKGN